MHRWTEAEVEALVALVSRTFGTTDDNEEALKLLRSELQNAFCVQSSLSNLSRRQREVLALLLVGKSCKQIARELQLSVHTVNDYIKAIYKRYDVSCRAELLAAERVPSGLTKAGDGR